MKTDLINWLTRTDVYWDNFPKLVTVVVWISILLGIIS